MTTWVNLSEVSHSCYLDTMALLESLKKLGSGAKDLLLGQRLEDVELGEDAERRRALERRLLELQGERVLDGQSSGQARAARTAGDEAIARLRGGLSSRRAAAGSGPAGLLAARQTAGQEVAGRTAIERGVTQTAQQAEAAEMAALRQGLSAERASGAFDEEERERRRRKGLLPALTSAAGSLHSPQGGALGGVGGQAILSSLGR